MQLLIVDDDKIIVRSIEKTLDWTRYGFDKILTASNGLEALELLKHEKIDMIISDIQMPIMNGLEFLEGMKALGINIPVFIVSNYDDFHYVKLALKNGAVDYILKYEIDDAVLRNFIVQFFRNSDETDDGGTEEETNNFHLEIKKAVSYIHQNYRVKFGLDDIACYCNLSSPYFSKLFKQNTGMGLTEYVNSYRIKKAEFLIKHSTLKIKEIAETVGFSDYTYFIRVYKAATGKTPSNVKPG